VELIQQAVFLKSDAGPDLRIYIAEDTKTSNFIEISSKVENGDKFYALPAKVDINKQKFILIWCKQFSVLFGHSELK
jgi:Electron transfer DM13